MPLIGWIDKMRSWMIGVVTAYVLVGFMPGLFPYFLLPLFLLTLLLPLYRVYPAILLLSGLSFGFIGGTLHGYSLLGQRVESQCEAVPITVEGEVISLPRISRTRTGANAQRFEFSPDRIEPVVCEGPGRLMLTYYGEEIIRPGQRWRLGTKLKKPWGLSNPGSFNLQTWYAQRGIHAIGNVSKNKAELLTESQPDWRNYNLLRQNISHKIDQLAIDVRVKGILRALTVADKSGVDSSMWTMFQHFGINHLLVISGLHIGFVAGLGFLLGGQLARFTSILGFVRLAGIIPGVSAFSFAFAYAALAGFGLSTLRAMAMLACFIFASFVSRFSFSGNNLLIGAMLIVVAMPLSVIASGFWLSFLAVACLLWLGSWHVHRRLPLQILHAHAYMSLAMIPLGGWFFGGVSQVTLLANLFLVPLVGLFTVPVALLGVVLLLCGFSLATQVLLLAAWPLKQLLPYAIELSDTQSNLLYSFISLSSAEMLLTLFALALIPIPLPNGIRVLVAFMVVPVFLPIQNVDRNADYTAKVTVLDVGQGTAVVVQSGGKTLLYDTGGGDPEGFNMANAVILPYLRAEGVRALDALVVSHGDNDHSSGIDAIFQSIQVKTLLIGGHFPAPAMARNCRAGEAWRWPSGVSFQVLSPDAGSGLSSNNSSCVVQVNIGEVSILLPGDIQAKGEKDLVAYWRTVMRSELLLVAHHGSATSSSFPWIKNVQPQHLVYSSGYLNQFGHPHSSVRARFEQWGASAHSTASQGALEIVIDSNQALLIAPHRALQPRYWM
jgi:competence protein ComEC